MRSVGADLRVLAAELAVHEYVDVGPQGPPLVEEPAARGRMLALELPQHLADGAALERELGAGSRRAA